MIILDEPNNLSEHFKKCRACNRPFSICSKAIEIHKYEYEIQDGLNELRQKMYLKYTKNPQIPMNWKEYSEFSEKKNLVAYALSENIFRK